MVAQAQAQVSAEVEVQDQVLAQAQVQVWAELGVEAEVWEQWLDEGQPRQLLLRRRLSPHPQHRQLPASGRTQK